MTFKFLFPLLILTSLLSASEIPQLPGVKVECGYLTLDNKEGKEEAKLFYVAYFKEEANRPITFCFNGGPGAASVFFHLGGIGPLKVNEEGALEKNPSSLFRYSDLVFIDALGTGFSRVASGVDFAPFLSFDRDAEVLAQGISLFLNKYQRWTSPLYLVGASYASLRIVGIGQHLLEKYHASLNGLLLVSGALDFHNIHGDGLNDLPYLFAFPTYVAINKGDTQQAEAYLEKRYQPALFLGDALSEKETQAVATELAQWTTLPKDEILKMNLRISPLHFRELVKKGEIIGRFDATVTTPSPTSVGHSIYLDPSFTPLMPQYNQAMHTFLQLVGCHEEKEPYTVLSSFSHKWKFLSHDQPLNVSQLLRGLLYSFPKLKVFAASGIYDLATPYYGMKYGLRHLLLDPTVQKRVQFQTFEGGHMFYQNPRSAEALLNYTKTLFEK